MKIEYKETNVTSNISTDNVTEMGIDKEGMVHIMSLLTNLYKNPELAVIREYFCNALDAHMAAGNTEDRVLVSLPTWHNPSYIVQDFGTGMSREDLEKIYSQYGASTKRNTNNEIGAFGLGCKSALAIATQFTLVTIKDGFKTTALISKTDSGTNSVNIVNHIPTEDRNGTTVNIPVENVYSFVSKANEFFRFVRPGSVLVDGNEPQYALEGLDRVITEDDSIEAYVKLETSYYDQTSYVIMGNVPYELSSIDLLDSYSRQNKEAPSYVSKIQRFFVIPIGSVDLTPSREGIRFTDKTKELIDHLIDEVSNGLQKTAQAEVDALGSASGYFRLAKKWKPYIGDVLTWNGEVVPKTLSHWYTDEDGNNIEKAPVRSIVREDITYATHSETEYIALDYVSSDTFIVSDVNAKDYQKVNRNLGLFMQYRDLDDARFIITDCSELVSNKWIGLMGYEVITASDITEGAKKQRKIIRESNASPKDPKSKGEKIKYVVLDLDNKAYSHVPWDEIDQGIPYLWASDLDSDRVRHRINTLYTGGLFKSGYYRSYPVAEFASHLRALIPTTINKIVVLSTTRKDEVFKSRVKDSYNILPSMRKSIEDVTDEEIMVMARSEIVDSSEAKRVAKYLQITDLIDFIDDPEFVAEVKENLDTSGGRAELVHDAAATLGLQTGKLYDRVVETRKTLINQVHLDVHRRYPLLQALSPYRNLAVEEVVHYMNDAYKRFLSTEEAPSEEEQAA